MAAKKYRSIVTGAGSPLGGRLSVMLARAGHDVIAAESADVLDVAGGRARARFETARDAGAWVQTLDIASAGALEPLLRDIDFLFLAARPREGDRSWKGLWRSVAQGTGNALESAARAANRLRRVVLFSSVSVVGEGSGRRDVDEEAPANPSSDLARALSLAEHVMHRRCPEAGLRFSIVRPGHLLGPDAGLPLSALFRPGWAPALPVPGDEACDVPLCHLDDACSAAVHLCKYTLGENGTFFVTDGTTTSTAALLRRVAEVRGVVALPLPGVPSRWLGTLASLAVKADQLLASRRDALPFLDPELAEALGADLRVSTSRLTVAGFEPRFTDPGVGLAALGAAVRGG